MTWRGRWSRTVLPDPATRSPLHIDAAKEILIQRQDTHLDSLAERLREARVRRVIEPLLAGGSISDVPSDDIRFVVDLGLVRFDGAGGLVIANPIYNEVLPRVLAGGDARFAAAHLTGVAQAGWQPRPGQAAGGVSGLLAAARAAAAGQRPLPRDCAAPGADGLSAPRRQRQRHARPRVRHRLAAHGSLPALRRRQPVTMGMELKVWRDGEATRWTRGWRSSTNTWPGWGSTAAGW
jgi:hypothetical protein